MPLNIERFIGERRISLEFAHLQFFFPIDQFIIFRNGPIKLSLMFSSRGVYFAPCCVLINCPVTRRSTEPRRARFKAITV